MAATLGARLGPAWTAETADVLIEYVRRARPLPILDAPTAPLGYLRQVLDDALSADGHEPPYWSRRAEQHRQDVAHQHRAVVAADRDALRTAQAATRATLDERDRAAVPVGDRAAEAELAALRARLSARRTGRGAQPDARPTPAAADTGDAWPEPAKPGAGLPDGWRHGDDRP